MSKEVLNVPPKDLPIEPTTLSELSSGMEHRLKSIEDEFTRGFTFIKKYKKSVSFFGSARFDENNIHYKQARHLAGRIVKELGNAIVTGGGPGIMEAGNRGALEAGGESYGIAIKLAKVQAVNPYVKESAEFSHFFVRKVMLSFAAESYIFFPGGFGTLDEFFELATLIQTHKIRPVPLILYGVDYWQPLQQFIEEQMCDMHKSIDRLDMSIYTITDDEDEIIRIIKDAPMRKTRHGHQ
ncbi:MAG TPA: TIGR00730 family Rossman fold protein [Candidatus Paceibacterota bacterium]